MKGITVKFGFVSGVIRSHKVGEHSGSMANRTQPQVSTITSVVVDGVNTN